MKHFIISILDSPDEGVLEQLGFENSSAGCGSYEYTGSTPLSEEEILLTIARSLITIRELDDEGNLIWGV